MKPVLIIIIGLTMAVTACDSSEDDELTAYINEVKSRKTQPIEPIPKVASVAQFVYPEIDTRRSPFKPREIKQNVDVLAPNTNRPKQPLEYYPLDALKFVGILKQGSLVWGLISLPNGDVMRVRKGNYLGQNYGKIIQINEKALQIEETLKIEGKWQKRITQKNLYSGE